MLRNSVKNGNVSADCSAQLELLPFSFVDVAEEMPLGLGLQDEVQNVRRPQVIVQDAVRRPVSNQNVDVVWDVIIDNPGISGDRANDNSIAVLYCILKDYDAGRLKLLDDGFISASVERQFVIAGDKEFPLRWESPEPRDEIVILAALKIILYGITGTNDNISILRHLQAVMVAMGVGECETFLIVEYQHPL